MFCDIARRLMTLILTIANKNGIFQSSDYQLTNMETGAPISDQAGSKQLQASFRGLDLCLVFTGVAAVGTRRTIDLLANELKSLPQDSQLQDICQALSKRCARITGPHGFRAILTLILGVASVGEPFRVVEISNVDWGNRPIAAKADFDVRIHQITKPFHLISGYRDSVPEEQIYRLQALARDMKKSHTNILKSLADINSIAASHGKGFVSAGCWVSYQIADGRARRSASINIHSHFGDIHLLMGGSSLYKFIGSNFKVAPGKKIRIKQIATVTGGPGDGIKLPPPDGEPRSVSITGSSVATELRSPDNELSGFIEITQKKLTFDVKRNEQKTILFADIKANSGSSIAKSFPKPLFPWPKLRPSLMIDKFIIPRGWEYSFGYWIEKDVHHLVIPQSSRSIRNFAFLKPDEELIIVAPDTTMKFTWGQSEKPPKARIQAKVWWRSRLDGTIG